MPTLQRMHQIVARHPTIQARLFLLMERLTITELVCCTRAMIGKHDLRSGDVQSHFFEFEDDYVSNGMPGLANFTTSLLEPLEAQGRGFSHGHKKVTGVPNCKAARIKDLLQKTDEDLSLFLDHMRTAVLEAASTIQYDAATLPAKQLSVETLPEVFTERQQLQSRMDGGMEVDGITTRPRIEVTPAEPQGHVLRLQCH